MSWQVWGQKWETSELTDASKSQKFTPNRNMLLRAVRVYIILQDDPTFTDLNAKIYSNETDDTAGSLIATSTDNRTKAELLTTEDHALKETYFTFADIPLTSNDSYHLVINGTGYTATADSFLAWRQDFPDPPLSTGLLPTTETKISTFPFSFYAIGADL